MRYFTFLLLFASMLSGCIEEYEADINTEDSNLLVVEGTICSGKLNKFTLTRTLPLSVDHEYMPYWTNETYGVNGIYTPYTQMVYGAAVSVRGSDGSEYRAEFERGCYECWIGELAPDVDYFLHIEADGEVYESEPQKPLRTEEIAAVVAVQNMPESDIDVLVTPEAPFEPDKVNYYTWTCEETWEVHSDYTTIVYFDTKKMKPGFDRNQFPHRGWIDTVAPDVTVGSSNNYDGQHIQRLKIYDIDRGDERMYYRYSGLLHQRAISKAEYEYELARRQASSEMGGLFTPQPSALPTNLRCLTSSKHVIGYVGCSLNTSEHRFFLDADDYNIYNPIREDTRLWIDNPKNSDCLRLIDNGMFLCDWIDHSMIPGGKVRAAWAFPYQLDVRYKGAYIEKPDFWPEGEE